MASRRKNDDGQLSAKGEISPPMSINDVELKVDADNDEGDADLEKVREMGSVSAESAARNAQTENVITGKRDRARRIRWNDDNAQVVYDSIRQAGWNTASTYVMCRRVTGEPAQWSIACSAIPSGLALHEWVLTKCHKQSPPHTYEIRVMDSHTNQERGRGKLFMPDTLEDGQERQVQQQPPNPYAQNPYAQYAQPGMPPPGWYPGMAPAAAAPAAPAAPPAAPAAPPPPPASGEVADLRAQVGFLSGQLAQLLTKVGMPTPPALAPQVTFVSPPTPPGAPAAAPVAQQPAQQQQQQPGTPPGLIHVPGFGYIQAELVASALMTQMRGQLAPQPQPPPAPPAPRPMPIAMQHAPAMQHPGHHDPNGPPHGGHLGALPIPRPEPPQSIGEMMQSHARNMKETAGGLAAMVAAADNMREVFAPEKDDEDKPAAPKQQDGSPAKKPFEVLDAGPVRVPYDPETGDMKGIANLLMVNADKIGGFVGKLYEKAAIAAATASAQQNGKPFTPPPSLPNGTATPNWPPAPSMPR